MRRVRRNLPNWNPVRWLLFGAAVSLLLALGPLVALIFTSDETFSPDAAGAIVGLFGVAAALL